MEDYVTDLAKLSLRNVSINVYNSKNKKIYDDFGEMEFTKYGLDGPIIKSASCRMGDLSKENYKIVLDLKPALDEDKLDKRVQKDFQKYANKNFENSLNDLLPKQLIWLFVPKACFSCPCRTAICFSISSVSTAVPIFSFIQQLEQRFSIVEMARTGVTSLERGAGSFTDDI